MDVPPPTLALADVEAVNTWLLDIAAAAENNAHNSAGSPVAAMYGTQAALLRHLAAELERAACTAPTRPPGG